MRLTILLFTVFLFFSVDMTAQSVAKTITFNSVTIAAGSPYIGADPSGGDHEDFALLIYCPGSTSLLFAGDWTSTTDVTAPGTYNFGPIFGDCTSPTWVLEPVDPAFSTFFFNIETFESGDLDCDGPYNPGGDDQFQEISTGVGLNITVGTHSFTQPTTGITYNYTVTSAPTTNTGLICGVDVSGPSVVTTPAVPTLSEWGLIILALLLMTAGTLYLVQPNWRGRFEQER